MLERQGVGIGGLFRATDPHNKSAQAHGKGISGSMGDLVTRNEPDRCNLKIYTPGETRGNTAKRGKRWEKTIMLSFYRTCVPNQDCTICASHNCRKQLLRALLTIRRNSDFSFFAHAAHFHREKCAWPARPPTRRHSIMILFVFLLFAILL